MYVNQTIYCGGGCNTPLIRYDHRGKAEYLHESRLANKTRLCTTCADNYENAREMGFKGSPYSDTLNQTDEGARRVQDWRKLPVATDEQGRKYPQQTFMTELGQAQVIDPEWAVSIIIGHGLATADVNRWLDTLRNPEAIPFEKERARLLLAQSAEEYKWICEKRELVSEKIQGPKQSDIKVTWKSGT